MTALGQDRRILRAFYTQYVAVLLIILVFFVAAFQTAISADTPRSREQMMTARSSAFGVVQLPEGLLTNGLDAGDRERLSALAEVLKTHDVTATVELTVARMALGEVDNGAIRAATLTEQLDQFFQEHGVPSGAVRYSITERALERAVGVLVRIHQMDGGHE